MLRAKRTIETIVTHLKAFVVIPNVASAEAWIEKLAEAGVRATVLQAEAVDVKSTRERLGLTQEQFSLRYGLDLDALRNRKHGRCTPDTAARSYLLATDHDPTAMEAALWRTG